jgi:hypothetical protein
MRFRAGLIPVHGQMMLDRQGVRANPIARTRPQLWQFLDAELWIKRRSSAADIRILSPDDQP